MGDRDRLRDVLGAVLKNLAPPQVTDMLALLVTRFPAEYANLDNDFIRANLAMTFAIEKMVRKYYEHE